MPANVAELLSLFNLERQDNGLFHAPSPEESLLQKTYGGQYLAQILRSAELDLNDTSRIPHAINTSFLSAGNATSPSVSAVETLHGGRSFSTQRVSMHQGDRSLVDATVSFHITEDGIEHQIGLPDVPHPDLCMTLEEAINWIGAPGGSMWSAEWPMLDFRYAGGAIAPNGTLRADVPTLQQFWMRINEKLPDDPATHRTLVTYLSDIALIASGLIPHGVFVSVNKAPRATLNHSLWLHESARADEWLLFDQSSSWANGARVHATSRIFTQEGRLVATAAQEGLIRNQPGTDYS